MAISRSEVAHIVQQAASRINLSSEIEKEIMESLKKEYVNDVGQLHDISLDDWKKMGAPIGFLASLEACLTEAGIAKDGKVNTNRRKSRKSLSPSRASGSSMNVGGSGRSATRQRRPSSRSTSRDDLSFRSTRSSDSLYSSKTGKGSSSHESRQAAVRELKDKLKAEGKQGRANTQLDTKGNKVYEWGQNDSCVLLYIAWPFEFEFGANTKFECKISKDTLLLKGKHKTGKGSLHYTTGGLVKAKLSEWCVVSKGKASSGDGGKTFAIEVTLFKKNVGLEWKTALFEDLGPPKSPGSLASRKGLRRARSTSPTLDDPGQPKSPGSLASKKALRRARSTSPMLDDPGQPKSPGSLKSKRGSRQARSTSPMVTGTKKNKFSEGQIVYYTSSDGQNKEIAKILKVHLDDDLVPFFDIRLIESGKEKQTTDSHLSSRTDEQVLPDGSYRSSGSGSSHIRKDREADRQLPEKSQSNGVPQTSRFVENEVVCYTNNGQQEKAKILKIHLDDDLIPFYDIQLVESGKEKQTTDARLSSLTDEVQASGLVREVSDGPPTPSEVNRDLSERTQSNAGPQKSRFVENEVVCYTNNGQTEKAKILKIHLDDDLIPFYDIRLVDSGKEKQTTDARLSSLIDKDQAPGLAKVASDGPPTSSEVDTDLSDRTQSNAGPQKSCFVENEVVCYTNNGQMEKAKILKIHLDDDLIPFYDIRLIESGKEKQTTDACLSKADGPSNADGLFEADLPAPPVRKLPDRSRSSGTLRGRNVHRASNEGVQPPRLARAVSDGPLAPKLDREQPEKSQSNGVPQKSRFVENEVVCYANNGQTEKAKILKIHLDDDLIPFYDIQLIDSGKEKQTTDARLSKADDPPMAEAQAPRLSGSSTSSPGPITRKLPGRSRSMNAGKAVGASMASPGQLLRKGRRGFHRESSSSPMPSAAHGQEASYEESSAPPARKLSDRSKGGDRRVSMKAGGKSLSPRISVRKSSDRRGSNKAGGHPGRNNSLRPSTTTRTAQDGGVPPPAGLSTAVSEGYSNTAPSISENDPPPPPPPLPARKLPGRSRSMNVGGVKSKAVGTSASPGQLFRKGRRGFHRESSSSSPMPSAAGHQASCEKSERKGPPERKLPDRSRSMDDDTLLSPGPLKKGRTGKRQSFKSGPVPAAPAQTSSSSSSLHIAHIKVLLKEYGGMSPSTYDYANEDEMVTAWNFIEADSKRSVGRIKRELRELGQSTDYIEKNELIGALCKARLEQKTRQQQQQHDKLGGSDRANHNKQSSNSDGSGRIKVQRRNSDGPLSMLRPGNKRPEQRNNNDKAIGGSEREEYSSSSGGPAAQRRDSGAAIASSWWNL